MRRFTAALTFIGVLVLALSAAAQAPDPFVGTWKLDVAKSKFAGPAPKGASVTIERMAGQARKIAVDTEDAAGAHVKWGYTNALDGKDAAVTGNPAIDTVSATETSPREAAVTYKKAGKVVSTLTSVVSADGQRVVETPSDRHRLT